MVKNRNLLFSLVMVVTAMACAEVLSWAFFHFYGKERFQYQARIDAEAYEEEFLEADIESITPGSFDDKLGWNEHPLTIQIGNDKPVQVSRITPYESDKVMVASYGDSFTYCQDVGDNETWQYYLSGNVKGIALNHGVRGYGTGQALLKLEDDLERGWKAPVIVLGVLSENIARVVNISPKYYWSHTDVKSLKPALVKRSGEYGWVSDHLQNLDTAEGRQHAMENVAKYDFWFEENEKRPEFSFPYIVSLVSTAYYFLFDVSRWSDLWEKEYPVGVMSEIIKRFYDLSKVHGFVPVVLFIPDPHDLKIVEKGKAPSYSGFVAKTKELYGTDNLVIVDVLDESFEYSRFNIDPFNGHASSYGNKVIAGALSKSIKKKLAGLEK